MQTMFTQLMTTLLLLLFANPVLRAQVTSYTELPIYYARNLICVEGTANQQSGFFLIDTGYEGTLLLNNKNFKGKRTERIIVGTNGQTSSLEMKTVDLQLGDLFHSNLLSYITDLSHLENVLGTSLQGVIGSRFLRDFEVTIDHTLERVVFIKLDKRGKKLVRHPESRPPSDSLEFTQKGHLPVIDAQVGELSLRLALDTGASSNLFHQGMLKKLEPHLTDLDELKVNGFGPKPSKVKKGVLAEMQVQELTFASMQTLFQSLTHINRELRGPMVHGILSIGSFGKRKLAFNYKKQVLYLWDEETIMEEVAEPMIAQTKGIDLPESGRTGEPE